MALQVFNQYLNTARTEVVDQAVNKFNAASNGAIVLSPGRNQGDYNQTAFYQNIANLIRRRNQYGTGAVSAETLTQLADSSVKVAAGTPPIEYNPSWYSWMLKNQAEAGATIGQQLGIAQVKDMLNATIGALAAGIANVGATTTHDGSAGDTTLAALNKGARLFGDRSSAISAWIMHSACWFDLSDKGLANAERLFTFENVSIMQDQMGRPFIVTDSPNLVEADGIGAGDDLYTILGLVKGGAVVEQNGDFLDSMIEVQGKENLVYSYQAEWTFQLGLKGYTWDQANGGKSPNDAALILGTNWDKTAASVKDTAGVAVQVGLTNP